MRSLCTALFLCTCVTPAVCARVVTRRASKLASNPTDPEQWVTFGYKTSANRPKMMDWTLPLFETSNIKKIVDIYGRSWTRSAESVRETATKVATESSIDGTYKAFSAAAQLSTEYMSNSSVKKFRLDRITEANVYKVTLLDPYPYQMLTAQAREFLLQESPERIVDTYGEFYARSIRLGGVFEVTNVVEMLSSDTQLDLKASVEGSYGLGWSVSATSEGSVSTSDYQRNQRMFSQWQVLGGEPTIWLGLSTDDSNFEDVLNRWSASFSDLNLYPVWEELYPMWELLEDLDSNKAAALESYLRTKWQNADGDITDGLPLPDLRLHCVGHDNEHWYSHMSQGRNAPSWAGRDRFCWWAFDEGAGPAGTQTYCQGKSDGYYSHLRIGKDLPSWAWRSRWCFDAWPDIYGSGPSGTSRFCQGWSEGYYTYLANGWSVPSWASRGRFCFHAYPEPY